MFMFISACSWRLCGAQRHLHLGGRRGETLTFHFPTFPHIHHIHDHDHQYHLDHLRRTDLIQSALTDVSTQNREKTLATNIVSGDRNFTTIYDTAKSVPMACINTMYKRSKGGIRRKYNSLEIKLIPQRGFARRCRRDVSSHPNNINVSSNNN